MRAAMVDSPAQISVGKGFVGSAGRWASEKLVQAAQRGEEISPKHLRTNEVLSNEEWKAFDSELILGAQEKLAGVADLIAAGLITRIPNGLAKTVLEYDLMGDMDPAIVSMDGITRSENDRVEFERAALPMPITHKDFYLNLRALLASRTGRTPLDTTYQRIAGRKCGEMAEEMLFNGGKQFQALKIYGYTNHPSRNTLSFTNTVDWSDPTTTGDDILTDMLSAAEILDGDGFAAPYWVYVGGVGQQLALSRDYKAATDTTIRARIAETGLFTFKGTSDKLAAGDVVIVKPAMEVVKMVEGEPLQNIQWDFEAGFQINFKAFQILLPLLRTDIDGNMGLVHLS
jgi:hypothetical protein